MLVEFIGQSVQDSDNKAVSTSRLINCYREMVVGQGKSQTVIQSVLGQTLLDDLGAATVRAMGRGNGKNWVVGNGKLFELADAGTLTERGVVADDEVTAIDGNYTDVTITSGGNYYVWDGSTVSEPTTKTFSEVGSHFFFGDYTILLEKDGKRFQWSNLGDAGTLDALNFSTANAQDDNLVRGFSVQGVAVLFCERSAEMWQLTGLPSAEAFTRVTSWNRGLRSANLACKFDDSLFFVGNDNNVYIGVGPSAVDITTPAINTALRDNNPTHCFYYEDRGHKFCVLRFSDRPAWVFDAKMQEWHERSEGADTGPFRAVASIEGDTWQIGNTAGEIHSLTRTNKDLNAPLRRTMISNPVYLGDRKFRIPKFEINCRVGEVVLNEEVDFALSLGDGFALALDSGFVLANGGTPGVEREGQVSLEISRDGGHTWTAQKWRGLGLSGDYDKRVQWRGLGQAQQVACRIRIDEPADFQVNSTAVLEVA